jgi:hypothetical protein
MPDDDKVRDNGDSALCSFEMRLWGIVHTVALEWKTLVIFRWDRYHVPERRDEFIKFFVPKDAVHRYEICEFIEGHLKELRREPKELEDHDHYWPGCHASIRCTLYTFRGVNPAIPAEASEAMAKSWMKDIMLDLGTPKRRARILDNAQERAEKDPEFVTKLLTSVSPTRLERLMKEEDDV